MVYHKVPETEHEAKQAYNIEANASKMLDNYHSRDQRDWHKPHDGIINATRQDGSIDIAALNASSAELLQHNREKGTRIVEGWVKQGHVSEESMQKLNHALEQQGLTPGSEEYNNARGDALSKVARKRLNPESESGKSTQEIMDEAVSAQQRKAEQLGAGEGQSGSGIAASGPVAGISRAPSLAKPVDLMEQFNQVVGDPKALTQFLDSIPQAEIVSQAVGTAEQLAPAVLQAAPQAVKQAADVARGVAETQKPPQQETKEAGGFWAELIGLIKDVLGVDDKQPENAPQQAPERTPATAQAAKAQASEYQPISQDLAALASGIGSALQQAMEGAKHFSVAEHTNDIQKMSTAMVGESQSTGKGQVQV